MRIITCLAVLLGLSLPVQASPYSPLDHGVGLALDVLGPNQRVLIRNSQQRVIATVEVVGIDGPCKRFTHSQFPGVWKGCRSGSQWALYERSTRYASIRPIRIGSGRCFGISVEIMGDSKLPQKRACERSPGNFEIQI